LLKKTVTGGKNGDRRWRNSDGCKIICIYIVNETHFFFKKIKGLLAIQGQIKVVDLHNFFPSNKPMWHIIRNSM
jgi:hypothetical protein